MLQDDIILNFVEEIDLVVDEIVVDDISLDLILDASALINIDLDFPVIVDLDSMTPEIDDPGSRYGKIQRVFFFVKSVLGKKTTFGKVSFDIRNNIQTIGTANIDPGNHNIIDFPITFGKTIAAQRTTFGQTSLVITNNIQVAGINTIGGVNFYGSGLYGDGIYSGIMGYGAGVYGFGIYVGDAISLVIRFGSVISGNIPYKQTAVAEVSLASHGTPAFYTNHSIKIKARTTSGSSGVLKVALYEGATNRSGNLETPYLTNTLTNYTLNIPEAVAATITDYSNLSIKFWGYDLGGNALVFEVSEIYLELPIVTGGISYGIISRQFTFGRSVSGNKSSKSTSVAEISLPSSGLPTDRTNHIIKLRARTTSGSSGVLKAALYEGTTQRSGILITAPLTNTFTNYTLIILTSDAATITDYSNLSIKFWGFDILGNALAFEVSDIYLELPTSTGNITQYGVVSRAFTFTKAVAGIIKSKRTATAEISLASHGTPSVRTNHSIKVRVRTTSGSTGVLKAELYEGSTLRSGSTPLVTSLLTNALADYTLAIPDAAVAAITSYANLSIKFWGFDSAGNALVFEVSRLYLELPTT
jgi:hypothetical protein